MAVINKGKTSNGLKRLASTGTLQETMEAGKIYTQTIGGFTYNFWFDVDDVDGKIFKVKVTDGAIVLEKNFNINGLSEDVVALNGVSVQTVLDALGTDDKWYSLITNAFGQNQLIVPARTSGGGADIAKFQVPNNKPAGTYIFQTIDVAYFAQKTTAEINAVSSPIAGQAYFNTTLGTICFYDGASWKQVTNSAM